jgi:hypothetical protein
VQINAALELHGPARSITYQLTIAKLLLATLFLFSDLVQYRHSLPSRPSKGRPGSINLFGVYHYDARNTTVECTALSE